MKFTKLATVWVIAFLLTGCADRSVIFESDSELNQQESIKIHSVRIEAESDDSLTVALEYSYRHQVPAQEIKLFVMPDHMYWNTRAIDVQPGRHQAQAIIGLSKRNMAKDSVTESRTSRLRIRFEHYEPERYVGNIWGLDVDYPKQWKLSI